MPALMGHQPVPHGDWIIEAQCAQADHWQSGVFEAMNCTFAATEIGRHFHAGEQPGGYAVGGRGVVRIHCLGSCRWLTGTVLVAEK